MAKNQKKKTTKPKPAAPVKKARQKHYVADLRIESPSSLGSLGLSNMDTAPALIRLAKVKGLDIISVTDFYNANYIDKAVAAADGTQVRVLPGVMIRCQVHQCNEVIMACFFPEDYGSQKVSAFMRALGVPESAADDPNYVIAVSFEKFLQTVERHNGITIPSRMDKTPYRQAAIQSLVEEYGFRTFDLAYYPESIKFFKENWPKEKFNLLSFSNASALAQVGSKTSKIKMTACSFEGLKTVVSRTGA